jgi:hypothetical protein
MYYVQHSKGRASREARRGGRRERVAEEEGDQVGRKDGGRNKTHAGVVRLNESEFGNRFRLRPDFFIIYGALETHVKWNMREGSIYYGKYIRLDLRLMPLNFG